MAALHETITVDCFGPCGGAPVHETRVGRRRKHGFAPLEERSVAGRFIAPGWTGVPFDVNQNTWPYWDVDTAEAAGVEMLPIWHEAGDTVRLRTSETAASLWTALQGTFDVPNGVSNANWSSGGADPVNTYIQTGFWLGGVRTFRAGDLVYRCRPSADESETDFDIRVYLCTAAVSNAIDPASDAAHFRLFLQSGGTHSQRHIPKGEATRPPGATSAVEGQIVSVQVGSSTRWRRAMRNTSLPAVGDDWAELQMARPLFAVPSAIGRCTGLPAGTDLLDQKRWQRMAIFTSNGVDAASEVWTCGKENGQVSYGWDHALSWGQAPGAPQVGDVIETVNIECEYNPTTGVFTVSEDAEGGTSAYVPLGARLIVNVLVTDVTTSGVYMEESWEYTCTISHTPATQEYAPGQFSRVVHVTPGGTTTIAPAQLTRSALGAVAFAITDRHRAVVADGDTVGNPLNWTEGTVTFRTFNRKGGNYPFVFERSYTTRFNSATGEFPYPSVHWARLKRVEVGSNGHTYEWTVLAAEHALGIFVNGLLLELRDTVREFDVTQTVTLSEEYTLAQVYTDMVMGEWGAFPFPNGLTAVITLNGYTNQTLLQQDMELYRQDARWALMGPKACMRTRLCGVTTCQTLEITAGCGGTGAAERIMAMADLYTSVTVQDNCQCAP